MHWFLSKILKISKPSNYKTHYQWVQGRQVSKTTEPTKEEIKKLEEAIADFETRIDVDKFKEQIKAYTEGICHIFDLDEFVDIDVLAESSYKNYLAKLFQNVKYINTHPDVLPYVAERALKFDEMEILEMYPFLDLMLFYADQTTISRRAPKIPKWKLNNSINSEIYNYAKIVYDEIKSKEDSDSSQSENEVETIIPETPMNQPAVFPTNSVKSEDDVDTDLEEFLDKTLENFDLQPKSFDSPISLNRTNPFNDPTTNVNSYQVPYYPPEDSNESKVGFIPPEDSNESKVGFVPPEIYKRAKYDEELQPLLGHNETLQEEEEAIADDEYYDADCEYEPC